MSSEEGNESKRIPEKEVVNDVEEEVDSGTPKSTSSDGTNQSQQNQANSDSDHPSPMIQRPQAISSATKAEFPSTLNQQRSVASSPSTPGPGTPQSVTPATMDLLPQTGISQPIPRSQSTIIPQQNILQNPLLRSPPSMSMVGTGISQVPINHQPVQNMRNIYLSGLNNYNYRTANLPIDYGFEPPPAPQFPIGSIPPALLEQLNYMQRYQQMANNASFASHGPQHGALQGPGYPVGGSPYHHFPIPSMPNPQMKVASEDQSFNWFLQGPGNQTQESNRPSTSTPRYTNSLYDPAYEEMGLPIDPHLRLFLASIERERAAGKERNKNK